MGRGSGGSAAYGECYEVSSPALLTAQATVPAIRLLNSVKVKMLRTLLIQRKAIFPRQTLPTLPTLPLPLPYKTTLATFVCPVVRTPLPTFFIGSIPLWSATLFATVAPVCIPCRATVEVTDAVTATFVDGLLPGAVFLGIRTRTPYRLNR